jgi:hypothetical protein
MIWKRFLRRSKSLIRALYATDSDRLSCWTERPVLHRNYTQDSLRESVLELQTALNEKGFTVQVSGQFDKATKEAVEKFQSGNGLLSDGVVGPLTWAALLYPVLSYRKNSQTGSCDKVKRLQTLLAQEGFHIKCDGYFCKKTDHVLRKFQRRYGLIPNGVCSPLTWVTLLGQRYHPQQTRAAYSVFLVEGSVFEQLLMIFCIHLGIHFNPWGLEDELSLLQTFLMAYALTGLAPMILERLCSKYLPYPYFPILRYGPYVLVGFFWRPILQFVRVMILA